MRRRHELDTGPQAGVYRTPLPEDSTRRPVDSGIGPWQVIEVVLWLVCAVYAGHLINVHTSLHKSNGCGMTFIYRPIVMLPLSVSTRKIDHYQLFRYIEANRGAYDDKITAKDIPVLFVPGSGGASMQVRSLATVLFNKTESANTNFRFVFYAIDFNEELSFLSGETLYRQREFVVQCIEGIVGRHSQMGVSKLILFGHSFGGTIIYSLPAHPRVNTSMFDMMITLGSPINNPPVKGDGSMKEFFEEFSKAWRDKASQLSHVSIVSYSGGLKDFQVPDHLARGSTKYEDIGHRVTFRPSWSIRDVGLHVDHLCLLWCNQLIRHVSRLVMAYGRAYSSGDTVNARQITSSFYKAYVAPERRTKVEEGERMLFNYSTAGFTSADWRRLKFTNDKPYWALPLNLDWGHAVIKMKAVAVNCPLGVHPFPADMSFRSSENLTSFSANEGEESFLQLFNTFPETHRLKGVVVIGGTPGCEYEVETKMDVIASFYKRLLFNLPVPTVVFFCLFISSFIPMITTMKRPPTVRMCMDAMTDQMYTMIKLLGLTIGLVLLIMFTQTILHYGTIFFFVRLISFLAALPLQILVGWINSRIVRLSLSTRKSVRHNLSLALIAVSLYSIDYAYAVLVALFIFKAGLKCNYALVLCAYTSALLILYGSAAGIRDDLGGLFSILLKRQSEGGLLTSLYCLFFDPHPLACTFFTLLFAYAIDASILMQQMTQKKRITLFYLLLFCMCCSLSSQWMVEGLVTLTGLFLLCFEIHILEMDVVGYSDIDIDILTPYKYN